MGEGRGQGLFSVYLNVRACESSPSFIVDRIIYGVVFRFATVHPGEVARLCGHVFGEGECPRGSQDTTK